MKRKSEMSEFEQIMARRRERTDAAQVFESVVTSSASDASYKKARVEVHAATEFTHAASQSRADAAYGKARLIATSVSEFEHMGNPSRADASSTARRLESPGASDFTHAATRSRADAAHDKARLTAAGASEFEHKGTPSGADAGAKTRLFESSSDSEFEHAASPSTAVASARFVRSSASGPSEFEHSGFPSKPDASYGSRTSSVEQAKAIFEKPASARTADARGGSSGNRPRPSTLEKPARALTPDARANDSKSAPSSSRCTSSSIAAMASKLESQLKETSRKHEAAATSNPFAGRPGGAIGDAGNLRQKPEPTGPQSSAVIAATEQTRATVNQKKRGREDQAQDSSGSESNRDSKRRRTINDLLEAIGCKCPCRARVQVSVRPDAHRGHLIASGAGSVLQQTRDA